MSSLNKSNETRTCRNEKPLHIKSNSMKVQLIHKKCFPRRLEPLPKRNVYKSIITFKNSPYLMQPYKYTKRQAKEYPNVVSNIKVDNADPINVIPFDKNH